MVRAPWRRGEAATTARLFPLDGRGHQVTDLSEIPCRVMELPELGVIRANRLITGKPSSYAAIKDVVAAKG
jgi:hypothetical protein